MPVLYVHAFSPQKQRINLQIYATSSFVTNEWEGKKRPFCETCDETGYSVSDAYICVLWTSGYVGRVCMLCILRKVASSSRHGVYISTNQGK